MQSPHKTTTRILPLGALAIFGLASCSLPPEQAWRQIREDGLITYWMRDTQDQPATQTPATSAVAATTKPAPATTTPATAPAPSQSVATTPAPAPVPPPSQLSSQSLPVAQTVPGLEGYVRTPFTNPPRLVDVRGMTAGSKVVCPYTRRPFLVPQGSTASQQVASAPAPAPTPKPAPTPAVEQPKPQAPAAAMKQIPQVPTKVAANTATAPQPPPSQPAPQPQVKPNPQPQPQASTPPAPKVTAQQLPFGAPIPGRPGFVNSPYAAKHQLVDVTGLPTGMEVKCPYTGKLFRVPPSASDASSAPQN